MSLSDKSSFCRFISLITCHQKQPFKLVGPHKTVRPCKFSWSVDNRPLKPNEWAANQISFIYIVQLLSEPCTAATWRQSEETVINGGRPPCWAVCVCLRMLLCLSEVKLVDPCRPRRSNLRRHMLTEPSVCVAGPAFTLGSVCVFVSDSSSVFGLLWDFSPRQLCRVEPTPKTKLWFYFEILGSFSEFTWTHKEESQPQQWSLETERSQTFTIIRF